MANFTFINFNPTPQISTVRDLIEIEEVAKNIANIDFDDSNDNSNIRSIVNKNGEVIHGKSVAIVADILTNVQIEFSEKYELYVHLTKDESFNSYFPFSSWAKELSELKYLSGDVVYIDMYEVLNGIISISKNTKDEDLLISNFSYFLDSKIDAYFRGPSYYNMLDFVVSQINPNINTLDLLMCDSVAEYTKILRAKKSTNTVDLRNYDRLVDAALNTTILNSRDLDSLAEVSKKHKEQDRNPEKTNFKEHCSEFANSGLWQRLMDNKDALNNFIKGFGVPSNKKNYFFKVTQNSNRLYYGVSGIKSGNLAIFFDEVIKGNTELGNQLLDNMQKYVPAKLMNEFSLERLEAEKVMSYYKLQQDIPIEAEFVSRKPKV